MKSISLELLSDTEATIVGRKAYMLAWAIINHDTWIKYYSTKDDYTKELAELFVANHSALETEEDILYTSNPLQVFRYSSEQQTLEGLLYTNGAVLIARNKTDEDKYILAVHPKVQEYFKYPASRTDS